MSEDEEVSPGGFFTLRSGPVPGDGHLPLARLYAGRTHRSRLASTRSPNASGRPSGASPRPSRSWGSPRGSGPSRWDLRP